MSNELLDWAASQSLARASDPQTSVAAAEEIAPKLCRLHLEFIEKLRELGPSTSNEVAAACAPDNFGRRNTLRRRASDLVKPRWGEKIRVVGERVCEITKRPAKVYEVVE